MNLSKKSRLFFIFPLFLVLFSGRRGPCGSKQSEAAMSHPAHHANRIQGLVSVGLREQRRQIHNSWSMGWIVGVLMAGMMLFASVSEAAIEIDAVSSGTGTGSSITVSHITGSGTNHLMLVGISGYRVGADPTNPSVTYGGVALTLVGTQASPYTGERMWIYQLVAPASGTADVVVTFAADMGGGAGVGVITFTGVNQTTPLGTFVSASGDSTTASVTNVSSATGWLVFDTLHYGGPSSTIPTVGAGQTQQWNLDNLPGQYGYSHTCGSTKPGAATTMSWTFDSNTWALGAVPIKPDSVTAVTLTNFTATQYEEGVLLRWKTGYEVNNLGFHIYREEGGQLYRLTPEPVAGSALLAGSRTALTAGHHYHWWDALLSPQSSSLDHPLSNPPPSRGRDRVGVRYWLEDIDLNGTHTMHGPVTPVLSHEPLPVQFRPELLSEVGLRLQEKYRDYWRVQELKEKLNDRYRSRITSFKDRFAQGSLTLEAGKTRSLASSPAGTLLKGRRPAPRGDSVPDPQTQQFLAGGPAIKILVREEGWYRVTQPELVTAGLSSKVNPKYLQLYVEGQEQPIRVIGEKDGRFDPGDAIEFYGVGLDTPFTDTRVYWLVEGLRPGKRIEEYRSHGGQLSFSSFPYTMEKKPRAVYFAALKNGDEENFFGPLIWSAPVDQILNVEHHDRATMEDALLEVVFRGVTNVAHRVKVLFNEVEVGEVTFEGQSQGLFKVEVSQSGLLGGENLVSLIGQEGEMDVSLLDFIRLTYRHLYRADDDSLKCTAQGGRELTVDGFSHSRVRVIDITDPDNLFEVFGTVKNRESGYAVTLRVPESGERTLLGFTEEKAKRPIEVFSDRPSFWHQERKGYHLIIISHRDFFDSLQPLKSLRESQGLKVALVDVEDIYDEFNFGEKSPQAIKDFLTLAKSNWQKPPRFVLLVGDASYDPRNYLGLGDFDFVPTKLIDTAYLETASDDWFVDFNNDGLPEMAVGRLPVQTVEEAALMVSKIVGYERSGGMNEILLVSDRKEKDFDFEAAILEVKALVPPSMNVKEIFRGNFGSDAEAKEELLRDINEGPLLVNFIGHGSVEVWRGNILTSDDAEGLINKGFSFFVNMTCFNGFFQTPYADTLAEALLKAEKGGAIAVWTSSGMTEPDKQAIMNKELIRLLFNGESLTLGEATAKAKASVGDQDVRRTWILFGDPTTRLR